MLRFFRNIRQKLLENGNIRKYFWYALGEILLVVIGILIALQINNWNETRKERKIERSYIKLLTNDLKADSNRLEELILFSDNSVASKQIILDYLNRETPKPDSLGSHFLRASFSGIQSFVPNKSAFEEVRNAGGLSLIKDENVRNSVLTLYNAYDEMEHNTSQYYLQNRWETRSLVYEKANGDLFLDHDNVDEEILEDLFQVFELKGRIINNWAVTYNQELKLLSEMNAEVIEICNSYLESFK